MLYSEKLRRFARYLEEHPVLDEALEDYGSTPSATVFVYDDETDKQLEKFRYFCSHLGGFEKSAGSGSLDAVHVEKIDGDRYNRIFRMAVYTSGVCEQRPKVDDDGNPVMRKKTEVVETDEEEQEMEWVCPDSWLPQS